MKIFITGGLGFVGRHLTMGLLEDGHQVTAVGRSSHPTSMIDHPAFNYLAADTTRAGAWQTHLPANDIVVNLAGKSIFTYWTPKSKQKIYDSRILTTRNLVQGLTDGGPTVLFSTSGAGYYGNRGDDILTEAATGGQDFLSDVVRDWEGEALKAQSEHTRVVLTRFGIVLDKDGGAMAAMIPAFRFFLGGRLGSGRQWFPWIHLHDLVNAYRFVIDHPEVAGPVNWCAPHPVRNRDLTRTLADKLHRPVMLPAPALAIKWVLGEFGAALLCSQRTQPAVLQQAGFDFAYPRIGEALDEILQR